LSAGCGWPKSADEADGRRQAGDALQRRPGQAKYEHADGFQVLPRPLQIEDIEGQRRFAGAGQASQDDELVLGDVDVKVLQVMETRATKGDDGWHWYLPVQGDARRQPRDSRWASGDEQLSAC